MEQQFADHFHVSIADGDDDGEFCHVCMKYDQDGSLHTLLSASAEAEDRDRLEMFKLLIEASMPVIDSMQSPPVAIRKTLAKLQKLVNENSRILWDD